MTKAEKEEWLRVARERHSLDELLRRIEAIKFHLDSFELMPTDKAGEQQKRDLLEELKALESNEYVRLYRAFEQWETED